MSKILVTGGAGFIGSHITDALIKAGHKTIVIDNFLTGDKANINPKAKFVKLDICDKKLADIFAKIKPEIVFHLAAQIDVRKSVESPDEDARINILGSLNVIKNAHKFGCKKFIFSSTGGAIYGDADILPTPETYLARPVSPYGVAKLSIEHYLYYYYKVFGMPYVALRYANVYGPRQNSKGEAGVVAIFCDKILENKQPVIYGEGKQTRDYVYVGDIVKANLVALKSKKVGYYNVGTGIETSVNEIAKQIKKALNSDIKFFHAVAKQGEVGCSCLDYKKIKKELAWAPKIKLKEGIKQTVEWFKKNKQKIL